MRESSMTQHLVFSVGPVLNPGMSTLKHVPLWQKGWEGKLEGESLRNVVQHHTISSGNMVIVTVTKKETRYSNLNQLYWCKCTSGYSIGNSLAELLHTSSMLCPNERRACGTSGEGNRICSQSMVTHCWQWQWKYMPCHGIGLVHPTVPAGLNDCRNDFSRHWNAHTKGVCVCFFFVLFHFYHAQNSASVSSALT